MSSTQLTQAGRMRVYFVFLVFLFFVLGSGYGYTRDFAGIESGGSVVEKGGSVVLGKSF